MSRISQANANMQPALVTVCSAAHRFYREKGTQTECPYCMRARIDRAAYLAEALSKVLTAIEAKTSKRR